jgi:pyruvate,water dikinase
MLKILEKNYFSPVDTEFTVNITQPDSAHPDVEIVILQCRPQSHLKDEEVRLPKNLPQADIIFSTPRMAPQGRVRNIHYVLFVSPECYHSLPTPAARAKIGHLVGRLNIALEGETFICIGPGRWGTSNPDLGVKISYSDIYHTQALVELTGQGIGMAPEPSFGTHFFQDMVESNIFPLAIYLDDEEAVFSRNFFYNTPNCISDFISGEADTDQCLRLIRVSDFRPQHHLELVMDDNVGISLAFLERDQ